MRWQHLRWQHPYIIWDNDICNDNIYKYKYLHCTASNCISYIISFVVALSFNNNVILWLEESKLTATLYWLEFKMIATKQSYQFQCFFLIAFPKSTVRENIESKVFYSYLTCIWPDDVEDDSHAADPHYEDPLHHKPRQLIRHGQGSSKTYR